jgi:DNA-binding MarR family transcriptional regulator
MMQQLRTQPTPALEAFGRLIRAHAELTRALNAQLVAEHDLTLAEYEVLLLLSRADDRRLKRVDLAGEVKLSASGVTRLLGRLEADGYVEKGSCDSDARITYAVLTDAGLAKLRDCAPGQEAAIDRVFAERFEREELESLRELLGRLGEGTEESCSPPELSGE